MRKLISRVIGSVLTFSIIAAYFCGCSLFNKNQIKIEESINGFWESLVSEDVRGQSGFINRNDARSIGIIADDLADNYSDICLIRTLITSSEVEVGDIKVHSDRADVTLEIITKDYSSFDRRIRLDELIAGLNSTSDTTSEEVAIEMIKVEGEWLLTTDAIDVISEYFSGISSDFEFYGIPEAVAISFVENLIEAFKHGDYEGASGYRFLAQTIESYPEQYRDAIRSCYMTIFRAYFITAEDLTFEVVDSDDDSVNVLVRGTIVDAGAAWETLKNDRARYVELLLGAYRFAFSDEDFDLSDYASFYAETFRSILELCDVRTDFEVIFPVSLSEDGELQVYLEDMFLHNFDIFSNTGSIDFASILEEILNLTGDDSDDVNPAPEFSYTENDNIYSCTYSISENTISINLITWEYYDKDTTFIYDVYKNNELVADNVSFVIPEDHTDDIVMRFEDELSEEEELSGSYSFVLYDVDGVTEIITVSLTINGVATAIDVTIPNIPSEVETGESMTYVSDFASDIYYVHFENLINDQPPSFCSGDDGFVIDVCTMQDYSAGDAFVYAVYRDGVIVGEERIAFINLTDGLDRIKLIYEGENSSGLEVGDYTIVLYNINSSDVLLTAYLTVT